MDKKQLMNDLKQIVLKEVPNAVKKITLENEDKVCYISLLGTDDEPVLGLIQLGIESYRNEIINEVGIDDKWTIWNSGEMPVDYQTVIDENHPEFREKQELLVKAFGDDWEDLWEDCQTLRFELAQELNQYNWSEILPITEDFVVYSDWEAIDVTNGDLERSIPIEKLNIIKDKQLI
ncbi:hypothetical protein [Ureibacillus acetophenoni]|uniref:DUF4303 domain-containing protein n=1 Tax=Ureibacillus acetophenoni TaxID=614649 RepID=A0A285UU68_9BACL|nr:hypothetical protein [Ureibacillus acetophenoni]SOC44246.1 hypothetical protein SAMN05877842_11961 [Ureibacillus acetophenoni]